MNGLAEAGAERRAVARDRLADARDRAPGDGQRRRTVRRLRHFGLAPALRRRSGSPAARGLRQVHPRWGTPYISILALGVLASFLLIAIQLGDTMRAAYQALVSLMVITGFLPYLYIFGSAWKAGKRVSALSGWAITLLAILCSVVPTAEITNVWLFEAKLAVGTAAVIATAWLLYRRTLPGSVARP